MHIEGPGLSSTFTSRPLGVALVPRTSLYIGNWAKVRLPQGTRPEVLAEERLSSDNDLLLPDVSRRAEDTNLGCFNLQRRYSVVVITWDSDILFPKPRFEPW